MTCHISFTKLSDRPSTPHGNIIQLPRRSPSSPPPTGAASVASLSLKLTVRLSRWVGPLTQGNVNGRPVARSRPLGVRYEDASIRPDDRELAALLFLFTVIGLPLMFFGSLYLLLIP